MQLLLLSAKLENFGLAGAEPVFALFLNRYFFKK